MISFTDNVASFMLRHVLPVRVHNQCSDFELVSPAYCGRDIVWHIPPDQKVDANAITRASFGKNNGKNEFTSILVYKLQKCLGPDGQPDAVNIQDTTTSIHLLVIWKLDDNSNFSIRALLIKHSSSITWDEYTLEKLYSMHLELLRDDWIVKDTWLLDNATVLMTTSEWEERSRTFEITLSKGTRKDDSMKPLWVSSNM
jgi:hypothetical protein